VVRAAKFSRPFQARTITWRKFPEFGGCCEVSDDQPNISDVFRISVVMSFATSKRDWKMVAKGALLDRAPAKADGKHAALIESYDLKNSWAIGKNPWDTHKTLVNDSNSD
jgi:hypothetical protein